jgi:hypothetical protein
VIRFPRVRPAWLGTAHRLTGTLAFLLTLPVAYHCLWALGFQDFDSAWRRIRSRMLLLRGVRGEGDGRRAEGLPRLRCPSRAAALQRARGDLVDARALASSASSASLFLDRPTT